MHAAPPRTIPPTLVNDQGFVTEQIPDAPAGLVRVHRIKPERMDLVRCRIEILKQQVLSESGRDPFNSSFAHVELTTTLRTLVELGLIKADTMRLELLQLKQATPSTAATRS